mmetsp:Transcript_1438/g.1265  ORF Transcript_1438/g.1265 Transcript_1438/m.1265 type:complete len:152 (+) Transcript_1438:2-457(+)
MKIGTFAILLIFLIQISLNDEIDKKEIDKIYSRYLEYYDGDNQTISEKRELEALDEFVNVVTDSTILRTFTPTAVEETYLNTNYFANIGTSKQDTVDYSSMSGIYATEEGRAIYYYSLNCPTGYVCEFPNPVVYEIRMLINPCINRSSDLC